MGTALRFEPALIGRVLRGAGPGAAVRLERAFATDRDAWEASLVSQVVGARSLEEAQAEANAWLMEVDGRLTNATRVYAACARIAVFGCLLGAAVLFMTGKGLTIQVIDVFAIGASGVLVTLAAGKEAGKVVKHKREAVDEWVELVLRSRWPSVVWDQE